MAKVLIFDTSILCVWLQIPGKETCGSQHDSWNYRRVKEIIDEETKAGTYFVLPLATIIETGNHIAQSKDKRYEKAQQLADLMIQSADQKTPWAAFTEQSVFWQAEGLKKLAETWPQLANQGLAMGDATIKDIAEYYHRLKNEVEILTGDQGLKSYQPTNDHKKSHKRRRK